MYVSGRIRNHRKVAVRRISRCDGADGVSMVSRYPCVPCLISTSLPSHAYLMHRQAPRNISGNELKYCHCNECKGLLAFRPRTINKHIRDNGRWQDPNVQPDPTLEDYLGPVASTSTQEPLSAGDKRIGNLEALEVAETRSPKRPRTTLVRSFPLTFHMVY